MKIRAPVHLQSILDDELGWRFGELSNFKEAISSSESVRLKTLLRASVPIAYAHWEGFVKRCSSSYANYLSNQGLRYSELRPCFMGVGVLSLVETLGGIKRKIASASNVLSEIHSFREKPVSINLWPVIEEVGNLNFATFSEIASFLNLDLSFYEARKNFIDETLISKRNRIAHGEWIEIDRDSVYSIFSETNILMRSYKTDIENAITAKSYLL